MAQSGRFPGSRALLAAVLAAGPFVAASTVTANPPQIRSLPSAPDAQGLGALAYRGGLVIDWDHARFGGFSALEFDPDGGVLVAVTDRGSWLTASPVMAAGELVGLEGLRLGALTGPDGEALEGRGGDAEALAPDGAGGYLVAFERDHRVWRYPAAPEPFGALPRPLEAPGELADLKSNRGVEALTRLCDGRLLLIAERAAREQGLADAWIGRTGVWQAFRYPRPEGSRAKGAVTLADCAVLVLERIKNKDAPDTTRIVRLRTDALRSGAAPAEPEVIGRLNGALESERFEAIAVRPAEGGGSRIFLMTDDGFQDDRRTLLLMFELGPEAAHRGGRARGAARGRSLARYEAPVRTESLAKRL